MPTRTDKVPNTSATAASSGTDLNGAAVADACRQLRATLAPIAASLLDCAPADVSLRGRQRLRRCAPEVQRHVRRKSWKPPTASACRSSPRATIARPEIHYDPKTLPGRPFYYFAYGAAVSEVEVDAFTGQHRLLRADILQDVGDSVSPLIDRGQVEGGFIQGAGWLTLEELVVGQRGPTRHQRRVHVQTALLVGNAGRFSSRPS